jgi:hypothetical protein
MSSNQKYIAHYVSDLNFVQNRVNIWVASLHTAISLSWTTHPRQIGPFYQHIYMDMSTSNVIEDVTTVCSTLYSAIVSQLYVS